MIIKKIFLFEKKYYNMVILNKMIIYIKLMVNLAKN